MAFSGACRAQATLVAGGLAGLLVGLANTTIWQFHGPDQTFTSSIIDFTLIQPLLRGAGREIAPQSPGVAASAAASPYRASAFRTFARCSRASKCPGADASA